MKPEKVKILCVGIGGYAEIYLKSLLESKEENFEIVGMVEIAPQNCKYYNELLQRGVRLYTSMEDFYKENSCDLAIITTPIHLHKRQIICALENSSNVMCEKPLSGVSADEEEINKIAREYKKFVIIGYQWSYSKAVNSLKADIMNGVYGKAKVLKSIVLWPRSSAYFTRSSGWAGKIKSSDGTVINDSVVNNATAHYLHNMLYVTGEKTGLSAEAVSVKSTLCRAYDIENFDTASVSFTLDNGAKGFFYASHATETLKDPVFEYRFENGIVNYDSVLGVIKGRTFDGKEYNYGDPFEDVNEKIYEAIRAVNIENYEPVCGVSTAANHVRCVEQIQTEQILNVKKEFLANRDDFLYVKNLDKLLLECYNSEKLLSDFPEYNEMVK